jgi:hypothetical protein
MKPENYAKLLAMKDALFEMALGTIGLRLAGLNWVAAACLSVWASTRSDRKR